jgi:poly(3-hydroxybutyrate) depolymerase
MKAPEVRLVETQPLRYLLSVPAGEGGKRPVLCFLHGYDEAAPLNIERALTRHGPLRPGSSPRAANEFIVVAPQLPQAGDIWSGYADTVLQIVTEVQAMCGGDPERTYLTGFSFGGNGVLDLALLQPAMWAALWPVDPTRPPDRDPHRPVWLSIGAAARYRRDGFIRSLTLQPAANPPHGHRLYLDEGQDHVGSARFAYADDRIYQWLLTHRLSAPAMV